MSIVLICGKGIYCYAEEESRTDEIVTNSRSDFDSENIVNVDQIDQVMINVNDKSVPDIADNKIESESGLSVTGMKLEPYQMEKRFQCYIVICQKIRIPIMLME